MSHDIQKRGASKIVCIGHLSCEVSKVSKYLFATTKKGTIKEYKKLLYKKQYTHLKVLQLRYSGRNSIIQVRIDLIFIMVPLGEQKQNGGGTDI